MTQAAFGRLLQWFCPAESYFDHFLYHVFTTIKAPWFFGRVETVDAQRLPTAKGVVLFVGSYCVLSLLLLHV
jgi:hypothetical protein